MGAEVNRGRGASPALGRTARTPGRHAPRPTGRSAAAAQFRPTKQSPPAAFSSAHSWLAASRVWVGSRTR